MTPDAEQADDFPITWEDPDHAKVSWEYDRVHAPNATLPLAFDLASKPFVAGFGWMPHDPIQMNYYIYYPYVALPSPGDAPASADATDRLRSGASRWLEKILPEVQEKIDFYRNTDFDSMTDGELADEVERLPELRRRTGRQHTQVTMPAWIAMNLLIRTYKDLIGGSDLEALRLVQGYGNKSVEAGEALWSVSELAKSIPTVRDALLRDDLDESVLDGLAAAPEAAPFLAAFEAYLDEFGWRSSGEFSAPTWAEAPATPLLLIRAYMQTEGYDPVEEQRRLVEEREAATEEVMSQLDSEARIKLEDVLDAARSVARLMEDHNYWMDQRLYMLPRRLVLAAGRRLVGKDELADEADVFYLRGQELVDVLRGELSAVRETVTTRIQEYAHWKTVTPPRSIGAPLSAVERGRITDEDPEP
ncbi:MAG: hypothetical protein IIB23_01170, partial [Chloroflexi bacterium]|nr:hypothetical protein [Chloroflexota bacterium]